MDSGCQRRFVFGSFRAYGRGNRQRTVGFVAVALLAGAFFLLPKSAQNSEAVANPLNPATAQDGQITAPNQW